MSVFFSSSPGPFPNSAFARAANPTVNPIRALATNAILPSARIPNPARAAPTNKNPAAIAGQKSFMNLNIASTFPRFSGSENQSISLKSAFAKTILITLSIIFLKISLIGLSTFVIGFSKNFFADSSLFSFLSLFSLSLSFRSLFFCLSSISPCVRISSRRSSNF